MILDGIEYKQIPEKHYKSCDGCVFEKHTGKFRCSLRGQTGVECDNKIWVKVLKPFEVINSGVATRIDNGATNENL